MSKVRYDRQTSQQTGNEPVGAAYGRDRTAMGGYSIFTVLLYPCLYSCISYWSSGWQTVYNNELIAGS